MEGALQFLVRAADDAAALVAAGLVALLLTVLVSRRARGRGRTRRGGLSDVSHVSAKWLADHRRDGEAPDRD
jgi:hypothetical protein